MTAISDSSLEEGFAIPFSTQQNGSLSSLSMSPSLEETGQGRIQPLGP